ncbi:N-acetylglucosamine-6-phosphate deacetylase [Metasolibacillus meyeri]|uniref:N-acetylglucosamine-6-phosphate deacetylase n=1 Tax=Metasolibacillus meyeri TaxID=1071052 RepID=A0AAW9NQY2_9BACL|nr:N-acetylglucosamine-6-phosphate deacetylase [Metasolibacillus meyeri]MEC1178303.1 N-acetylglucosamine-6-phosphate deacetylase [Metasolibacillus meyeri]
MTKPFILENVTVVNYDGLTEHRNVTIEGAQIATITENNENGTGIDCTGYYCLPGFIDMHIHGADGVDTMDATTASLHQFAAALVAEGTTGFLATTMTQSEEAIEAALRNIATFEPEVGEANLLGVHLEGPFISAHCAGAQPIQHIQSPSIEKYQRWHELSGHKIKQMTIAPEEGMELVHYAKELGVIVSIGHSNASSKEAKEAVAQGVTQGTHLYNQMRAMHHREPGVVGAVLLERDVYVEMIVDFIHIHPEMVDLAYRLKGPEKIILITDAMRAKGLAYGKYDLGGQEVNVTEKGAHLANGALAGSILKMNDALRNMQQATGATWQELVQMSSFNAAKQLGLSQKGYIAAGKDADLVIVNENLQVQYTIVNGKIAYSA